MSHGLTLGSSEADLLTGTQTLARKGVLLSLLPYVRQVLSREGKLWEMVQKTGFKTISPEELHLSMLRTHWLTTIPREY